MFQSTFYCICCADKQFHSFFCTVDIQLNMILGTDVRKIKHARISVDISYVGVP